MSVPFCYCVVHRGCTNRLGVLVSQAWHAARECRPGMLPAVDDTEAVCVLEAASSDELELLSTALQQAGVTHKLIREPDAPWNGAATCLGVDAMDPETRARVKPVLATFKLLR